MAAILRIRNWEAEYENSDTKKVKHFTRYLPVPNDLSSFEYARIVSHENGEALAGAWLALRCVASKGTPRGYLVDSSGEPHTVESLTLVTRFSAATIQQALRLFQFWKMLESCSPDGTVIPTEIEPQISEDLRTPPETSEDLRGSPNTSGDIRRSSRISEHLREFPPRGDRGEERREEEICGLLEAAIGKASVGMTGQNLADLTSREILDNTSRDRSRPEPRGYGFPDWP